MAGSEAHTRQRDSWGCYRLRICHARAWRARWVFSDGRLARTGAGGRGVKHLGVVPLSPRLRRRVARYHPSANKACDAGLVGGSRTACLEKPSSPGMPGGDRARTARNGQQLSAPKNSVNASPNGGGVGCGHTVTRAPLRAHRGTWPLACDRPPLCLLCTQRSTPSTCVDSPATPSTFAAMPSARAPRPSATAAPRSLTAVPRPHARSEP